MAFHIRNEVLVIPPTLFVNTPFEITIWCIAHGRLIILVGRISPKQHAVIAQFLFLLIRSPMLQNNIKVRIYIPTFIRHAFNGRNTSGLVAVCI